MTYLTLQELQDAVKPAGRDGEEFYQTNPDPQFEDLLTALEEDSRAIINNQLKGEGYERETDREDLLDAPDKPHIQLVYPVDTVSQVEIQTVPDGEWEVLETELYSVDDQKIKLRQTIVRNQDYYFNVQNPLRYANGRARWSQLCDRVRVTYDRGYETANIPQGLKEVQKRIVRRMLTHLRQDQTLANISPDDVQAYNTRQLLTDDIMARIGELTQTKNKYVMLR